MIKPLALLDTDTLSEVIKGRSPTVAAREVPAEEVAALIAERTSPAVKAALQDLLSAPEPPGRGRGRQR